MSKHKLASPTFTYTDLPTVVDSNKDSERIRKQFHVPCLNQLIGMPGITASHKGQKNTQNQTVTIYHNPSGFNSGKRAETASNTRKGMNANMCNEKRKEGMTDRPTNQSHGQATKNLPTGSVASKHQSTSARPAVSKEIRGNAVNDGRTNPGATQSRVDTIDEDYVEESDSDFDDLLDFPVIKKRTLESARLPYTPKEDLQILKCVLTEDNIKRTGGLSMWRELEIQMDRKRTYQSLKNRFLRNIKPHLMTEYRKYLTKETFAKIRRQFPELRGNVNVNQVVGRAQPLSVGPSSAVNRPQAISQVQQKKPPKMKDAEASVSFVNKTAPVVDAGTDVIGSSPEKGVAQPEEVPRTRMEIVPATESIVNETTSKAVELFVNEKSQSLPVQSFRCTKVIKTLHDKTNLNLNVVLVNDQSSSILSKLSGPVKVDIIVSVSSILENGIETERQPTLRLEEIPSQPTLTPKKKKKRPRRIKAKPKPNRGLKHRYVLQLRRHNYRKLVNLTPSYKQTVAGLLRQIEENLPEKNPTPAGNGMSQSGRVLRSHARAAIAINGPESQESEANTQETNCSVDDESDYSQTYRHVTKTYQVVTESSESQHSQEKEVSPVKSHKTDDNPPKDNKLLKNMFGMLSPSSKVFGKNGESISKKL